MTYENSLEFAQKLDGQDELKHFRDEFLVPQHNGKDVIYLCGNSLGLQPKNVEKYLSAQLANWKDLAIEGWFHGDDPWLLYHQQMKKPLAELLGAKTEEITIMN